MPFIRKLDRAGAHWRTHAGANDIELQEWDADTYRTWMELAREEERNGTRVTGLGVCMFLLCRMSLQCSYDALLQALVKERNLR